jgi:GNAT superfamily N-acetyltransferase
MASVVYRSMRPGEEEAVADLASRVFNEFVAPGYSDDGVQEFLRYATAEQLLQRSEAGHFVLVAEEEGELVGLIEVRHCEHVAMLFVARQGRGVGKELVRRAVARCRQTAPALARLTVHAAPDAVAVYGRMGFTATGPERVENGIRFVPTVLELDEGADGSSATAV